MQNPEIADDAYALESSMLFFSFYYLRSCYPLVTRPQMMAPSSVKKQPLFKQSEWMEEDTLSMQWYSLS